MLDIVTVVFRKEFPLLKIQARSLHVYAQSQDINSITVVVNDSPELVDLIIPEWYGKFKNAVSVVHYNEIDRTASTGWSSQQLGKILAAKNSTVEWSLILDAKTFLVNHLSLTKIFNVQGLVNSNSFQISAFFNNERYFVEKLFNIQNLECIGPGGVPFLFHNPTVRDMIDCVEQITGEDFNSYFQKNTCRESLFSTPNLTEFILYSGYVKYKFGNFDSLYCRCSNVYLYYNISNNDVDRFDSIFEDVQRFIDHILTFSLHRKTYSLLTDDQKTRWLNFLASRDIVVDVLDTKNELNTTLTLENQYNEVNVRSN